MIQYRRELPKLLKQLGLPMIGVEVGVAQGSFSWELITNGMEKLYSVDAWKELPQTGDGGFPQSWHDDNYEMAKEKLSEFGDKSIILRGISHEMATLIEDNTLGLVYLDGDHSINGVRTDLEAWYSKLVVGGVIATHDYESPAYGTKQAFEEFAKNNGLEIYFLPEDKEDDAGAFIIKN
jgi:hypothetical protein